MAKEILFTPYGALNVKKGSSYTHNNITSDADLVYLCRGVRITDEFGNETNIRGVRMTITITGLATPIAPLDNVPFIWKEGDIFTFHTNGTYLFHDDGIVGYGKKVAA